MAASRVRRILPWIAIALAVVFGLAALLPLLGSGAGDDGAAATSPTLGTGPPPDETTEPATSSPATTALPSEQERREREVCEARARDAVVTYQPTKEMVVGEAELVEAIATSGGALPPDDLEGGEAAEDRETVLACSVEAELTGVDFEIEPSGPQQGSFLNEATVRWSWTVKPERTGSDLPLQLTIRGFVGGVDVGSAAARLVRGPDPIIVDISVESESRSATERLADFWFGFWSSTVWTAIAGVLSVLAFFGIRGRATDRGESRPKGPPPLPPGPPGGWAPPSSG